MYLFEMWLASSNAPTANITMYNRADFDIIFISRGTQLFYQFEYIEMDQQCIRIQLNAMTWNEMYRSQPLWAFFESNHRLNVQYHNFMLSIILRNSEWSKWLNSVWSLCLKLMQFFHAYLTCTLSPVPMHVLENC